MPKWELSEENIGMPEKFHLIAHTQDLMSLISHIAQENAFNGKINQTMFCGTLSIV